MKVVKDGMVSKLLKDTPVPKMFHVRQTFPGDSIRPEDIPGVVARELGQEPFASRIQPGMRIAITAGSRGIRNVDIITNTQTVEVLGNGDKVVGLIKKDRSSEKEEIFALDGIFVQIGLTANSTLFKELLETNRMGEILTDKNGRTSVKGIYAAGDVTDVSYKQIVIAMGEGAKAALAAFEDRMRGTIY